ncbi:MAG: hypothetical protein AAFO06_16930, partial [Cyanobacteria bacterium J06597_16]
IAEQMLVLLLMIGNPIGYGLATVARSCCYKVPVCGINSKISEILGHLQPYLYNLCGMISGKIQAGQ